MVAGAEPFSSLSSSTVMSLPCASRVARRTIFFIWRRLPGQGYSSKARDALSSKPASCLSISRLAWSRKNLAKSRMSSRRSLSCGMRRVNSLMRWYKSSRNVPFSMACSRFSLVADTRRTSTLISLFEPTGRILRSCKARNSCICTS